MNCLACNLEAEIKEQYKDIEIRVCIVGHRTGITNEPALKKIEPNENDWLEKAS